MDPLPTIAFVVNSLRFGGAEKHTLQLFNGLSTRGFKTSLAYLKKESHLLPEVGNKVNDVWCANFGKGFDIFGLVRLVNWVRKCKPDVLVCVNSYPLFYGYILRLIAGPNFKLVEIFHSTELPPRECRKMRWLYRPFFNRCDKIVYVSSLQRAYWEDRDLNSDIGFVIHNGIDSEKFQDRYAENENIALRRNYGFKPDDFVIGICAALRPEKKHEDLIKSVGNLRSKGTPAKCLIIGDGPRRQAIENEISRLGLEKDIAITGFQSDVRPYIAACDCIAIVSHQVETFSIAALEAMALSKPMVMSNIGGASEQITNCENGYLFPAGQIDLLTFSLEKLLDPAHRIDMGKKARISVAKKFDLDLMLESYALLFKRIISPKNRT